MSKRRSPAPDDLLMFVCPLCRPDGDPKPRACRAARVLLEEILRCSSVVLCKAAAAQFTAAMKMSPTLCFVLLQWPTPPSRTLDYQYKLNP